MDLLACGSGFVFCWLYADRIGQRRGGALCFYLFTAIRARGWRVPSLALVLAIVVSWAIVANNLPYSLLLHAATAVLGPDPAIGGVRIAHLLSHPVFLWLPFQLLPFPCTIVALALLETGRGTLGRRLSFLGDISYSSYLLHFPLQMTCVFFAQALGLPRSVFLSPAAYFFSSAP